MSSIFDALKKLEDEKSTREGREVGGDLLRPPPPGGRRRGFLPWLIVSLVIIAGGAIYLAGREGKAPVAEAPTTPVAAPATGVSPGAPAVAPSAPALSEEQKYAREQLLARIAKFRKNSDRLKGEEGEGASRAPAITATPPVPPRKPARLAPVYPETAAPDAGAQAPPAAVAETPAPPPLAADLPDMPDSPAAPPAEPWREVRAAPEPKTPPPLVKRQVPMMMVTEVTYHRQPELRTARIRIGGNEARLVREGDRYRGLKVKEITSGAITLDVAGTEVSVDVGDSLSFTVSEPDFH